MNWAVGYIILSFIILINFALIAASMVQLTGYFDNHINNCPCPNDKKDVEENMSSYQTISMSLLGGSLAISLIIFIITMIIGLYILHNSLNDYPTRQIQPTKSPQISSNNTLGQSSFGRKTVKELLSN